MNRIRNSIRHLPVEERVRAYLEALNRIFNEKLLYGMRLVTRRIKKTRERFKRRRLVRRQVVEAVDRSGKGDPRVFAEIHIGGKYEGCLIREHP